MRLNSQTFGTFDCYSLNQGVQSIIQILIIMSMWLTLSFALALDMNAHGMESKHLTCQLGPSFGDVFGEMQKHSSDTHLKLKEHLTAEMLSPNHPRVCDIIEDSCDLKAVVVDQ